MTNVSKAMESTTTFERDAMREKLDADIEQRDYALKTVVAFKEENTHLQAPLATTHYEGCWDSGPKHYECALLEVKRLRGDMNKDEMLESIFYSLERIEAKLKEKKDG